MTARRIRERNLPRILADVAGDDRTDWLDDLLDVTARTPQRRALPWLIRLLPGRSLASRRWAVVVRPALIVAIGLLVIAGLLALVGSQPRLPPPFGLADNGAIAFARDGNLFVIDAPGSPARQITSSDETDLRPVFSRLGDRLAFVRSIGPHPQPWVRAEVWVAEADGSGAHRIAGPYTVDRLEWMPRGDAVAVLIRKPLSSLADAEGRLVIAPTTEGLEPRLLDLGMDVDSPVWRPGNPGELSFCGFRDNTWDLYLAGPDGSNPRPLGLTRLNTDNYLVHYLPCGAWSSGGDLLAYAASVQGGVRAAVHVVEVAPGGERSPERRLEFDPAHVEEWPLAWLDDGRLLFQTRRGDRFGVALGDASGTLIASMPDPRLAGAIMVELAPDQQSAIALYPETGRSLRWDFATGAITPVDLGPEDVATIQRIAP